MYSDKTLTPKETVRFCALGILTSGACSYSQLATSVRHFIDRVQGPSLDVLGTSIELLKYEGLVIANPGLSDDVLQITEKGHLELKTLLSANIRAIDSDHNKLIEALKFRFLHLLEASEQRDQTELLTERVEIELNRLVDLRSHYAKDPGHISDWLDREISELENRLVWLSDFHNKL